MLEVLLAACVGLVVFFSLTLSTKEPLSDSMIMFDVVFLTARMKSEVVNSFIGKAFRAHRLLIQFHYIEMFFSV